ncbi:FHA domain-containing protein [Bacillus sp. BGMRC 2118]|nr:FHA domain-containing protein [Bacillus sp. BGMRC 2118]
MIKHLELSESNGLPKFLFYKVPPSQIDKQDLELIQYGDVDGLLPCVTVGKDADTYIRYDVVFERNLTVQLDEFLKKKDLTDYLHSLLESFHSLEEKGLNSENILLDMNYIFIDHFSNRLVFLYVPLKQHNVFEKVSMKEFIQDLLGRTRFDENDDTVFFIRLHNAIASRGEIDIRGLQEILANVTLPTEQTKNNRHIVEETRKESPASFYRPGEKSDESVSQGNLGILTSEYSSKKVDKRSSQKLEIEEEVQYKRITRTDMGDSISTLGGTSISISPTGVASIQTEVHEDEGTTVLGETIVEEEETTALGIGRQPMTTPYIVVVSNNKKVYVTKNRFTIGRDPNQVDFTSENKTVGRVHAELETVSGEYFLIDNKSTNGSFINGNRISPHEKMKLRHEDQFKLGNEEFVFRLF